MMLNKTDNSSFMSLLIIRLCDDVCSYIYTIHFTLIKEPFQFLFHVFQQDFFFYFNNIDF